MPKIRESKRERFVRVAETRTNKALRALASIGGCADVRSYEYIEADIEKIFSALQAELDAAKDRYRNGSGRKVVFKLNSEEREQEETDGDR